MTNEPTNRDLQSSVSELKNSVSGLESSVSELRTELRQSIQTVVHTVNIFAQNTEDRFQSIENELTGMKNRMVTKEYLDEKLYDLRGDLIQMTRKEDVKLRTLVHILKDKSVLNKNEANQVLAMEPFAKN